MTFHRNGRAVLALMLCASLLIGGSALATEEDHERGRALAVEGFRAYKEADYTTALESFEKASQLYPTGQVLRMRGYTLVALERWVAAVEALEAALSTELKPLDEEARRDVAKNLEKALSRTSRVSLESKAPGAFVSIDGGEKEPLPVNDRLLLEGAHRFTVEAPGYQARTRAVELVGGEPLDLTFELERSAIPSVSSEGLDWAAGPWKMVGLSTSVVGITSLGAGLATLVSGRAQTASVNDRNRLLLSQWPQDCSGAAQAGCRQTAEQNHRDGERALYLESAGVTMMTVGGVLLAGGVAAYVFAPAKKEIPIVVGSPRCTPGMMSLQCSLHF